MVIDCRRKVMAVLASVVAFTPVLVANAALGAGYLPPQHPSLNLTAVPAYSFTSTTSQFYSEGSKLPPCWKWGSGPNFATQPTAPACVTAEVAATNRAHRVEGLRPMSLPHNFSHLTVAEQLFVLVDIERVSRGELPVAGLSTRVNSFAQQGAVRNDDPSLPSTSSGVGGATGAWASNYAGGVNTLDANYGWMYLDGWAGEDTTNYDCTSATAPDCWGHRENILANATTMPCYQAPCSIIMGAGYLNHGAGNGYSSFTELLVQISGPVPSLYYSWKTAVAHGARG